MDEDVVPDRNGIGEGVEARRGADAVVVDNGGPICGRDGDHSSWSGETHDGITAPEYTSPCRAASRSGVSPLVRQSNATRNIHRGFTFASSEEGTLAAYE
jgi:hypothetical protein